MKPVCISVTAALLLAAVVAFPAVAESSSPAGFSFIDIHSEVSGDVIMNQSERLIWSGPDGLPHSWEQQESTSPLQYDYAAHTILDMVTYNESTTWNYRRTDPAGLFTLSESSQGFQVPFAPVAPSGLLFPEQPGILADLSAAFRPVSSTLRIPAFSF
ncbi:MAG: hypothetical protein LUQ25_02455 [Methanoregulaceae archaeon]|nr:hypothetical protein [Methanoregulaceae archaeon]